MTVCYFNGGTCNNAIPQTAEIMGTARGTAMSILVSGLMPCW